MTFLSPAFMFVFLPIALAIYALVPKYLKTYSLPLLGGLFYAAVNLKSMFALTAMPLTVILTASAVELYKKRRIRFPLNFCRVAATLAVFGILVLRITEQISFSSGIGVIICFMSSVSICSDVLAGKGRIPDTPWDVVVYMTFFPVMMMGPFIKYGDFVEKSDRIDFSLSCFSSGAMTFMCGAIKCVAVSAVLGEAYVGMLAVMGSYLSFFGMLLAAVVYGLRFFFFATGYSDMARGIASMLGLRLVKDYGNCFCNVTPCEYIRNFFSSLLDFCRSYITLPVSRIVSGLEGNLVAAVFAAFFYVMIFAGNMETVYTMMIPATFAMLFIVLRTGQKRRGVNKALAVSGCILTFITVSAVIWYIKLGGPDNMIRVIDIASKNPFFYISPHALAVLGDSKYILLPALSGCAVWLAGLLFKRDNDYLDSLQRVVTEGHSSGSVPSCSTPKLIAKYLIAAVILILFSFSVTVLLPQYPQLASSAYFFPFI